MALTKIKTDAISDDAVTLAKQAAGTDGQIITYDASGNPVAVGPGNDGQVLTSTGAGSPPTFEDVPAGGATINNANTNELVTVASTTTQLDAEANLTFDGNNLTQTTDADGEGIIVSNSGNTYNQFTFDANRSAEGNPIGAFFAKWNGNVVGSMQFNAGADTTNKDDGYFDIRTAQGGTNTERLRITQDGKVGINQTPTVSYLEISHAGTSTPENQIVLNTSAVSDGGGSGIFLKNSGATNENRYGSRIHTIRGGNGASTLVFSTESTGGNGLTEGLRIDSDQNVKVTTGNLVIGTSGKGIDFSATSDGSGTDSSELFDDYEEGTWTPAVSGTSITYQHQVGGYTKIGNIVYWKCYITVNGGTPTNNISGLPYAVPAGEQNNIFSNWTYAYWDWGNANDHAPVVAYSIAGTSSLGLKMTDWNGSSGFPNVDFGGGSTTRNFYGAGFYWTS